jgi:hypothetical protein
MTGAPEAWVHVNGDFEQGPINKVLAQSLFAVSHDGSAGKAFDFHHDLSARLFGANRPFGAKVCE